MRAARGSPLSELATAAGMSRSVPSNSAGAIMIRLIRGGRS
jgi:hypothetical protein